MPIDPYILFQGINPSHDYNKLAGERVDIARAGQDLKTRQLDYQANQVAYQADQIKLQQMQRQQAFQQFLVDKAKEYYNNGGSLTPPLTPEQLKAGGSSGDPGVLQRPQPTGPLPPEPAAGPPQTASPPPQAPVGVDTYLHPPTVQPGINGPNGLPGPGGIGWGSDEPISRPTPSAADLASGMAGSGPGSEVAGAMFQPLPAMTVAQASDTPPSNDSYHIVNGKLVAVNGAPVTQGGADQPGTVASAATASAKPAVPPAQAPADLPPPRTQAGFAAEFAEAAARAGFGPEAAAYTQAITKHDYETRKGVADADHAQTNAQVARYELMDNALRHFIDVTPDVRKADEWGQFIAGQVNQGHLTKEEAEQFREFPGIDKLPFLHTILIHHKDLLANALNEQKIDEYNSPSGKAERVAKSAEAQLKATQLQRADDAAKLRAAAHKGETAYTAALGKLPADRRDPFPDKWDENTENDVMAAGLDPEHLAIHLDKKKAEAPKQVFMDTMGKVAGEHGLPTSAFSDLKTMTAAINGSKVLTQPEKSAALAYLAANTTPASQGTGITMRMEGLGNTREYPVINKQTGQLEMQTPTVINANRGLYAPAGGGAQAMSKAAIFQDLHYNIDTARKAIDGLQSMSPATRAALAYSLRHTDTASAMQSFLTGAVGTQLTPAQQEAVQSLALLAENAMSLRSVAGMGQGSDELRSAILATIPSAKSPSKAYALGQLDKFEQVVTRLEGGVPGMGRAGQTRPPAGPPPAVTTDRNTRKVTGKGNFKVSAPDGDHLFETQAAADYFKKAAQL